METWPIGVFTRLDGVRGFELARARELGISTIQLFAPRSPARTDERARQIVDQLRQLEINLTAVFGGFEGESYADILTVARTVGLVPPQTREERLVEMQSIADFAHLLGCRVVALHLGLVPHETHDPQYLAAVAVTRALCDHCCRMGQALHLETGQESADVMLSFIRSVDRDNLFINFDPANMILYGSGDPIVALKTLGSYVRSVHCKDAKWASRPRVDWGRETPLGEGDVGMETFLRALDEIGYDGPLTIECEFAEDVDRRYAEFQRAVNLLKTLKRKILA
jgi:sugar phosphate isomerase/epimerase